MKTGYFSVCTGICVFTAQVHGKASLPSELRQSESLASVLSVCQYINQA